MSVNKVSLMKSAMNQVQRKLSKTDWKSLATGLLIAILVLAIVRGLQFNAQNKPILDKPIEEILVDIERDGRQANCSDLIGKWFVIENNTSYEFKQSGILSLRAFGGPESTRYRCNGAANIVSYTRTIFVGYDRFECPDIMYPGKISDNNMVASWDYCSEGEEMVTRTMVREPE